MARHVRLSAHGVLVALLASLVVSLTGSAAHAVDRNCPDFRSQRSAQIFFLRHGGPGADPHGLDADSDGIACEDNDAPFYFGRRLPHRAPSPAPTPAIASSVRLSARPEAAIRGERLALRVQVAPRAKRTVVLQRKVSSGWKRVTTQTTSRRGRLTYRTSTRPAATRYRAVVSRERVGARRYLGDVSRSVRVRTQRQSVVLGMPNGALVRDTVTAIADVTPARKGRRVELQRRAHGRWVQVDLGRESRRGVVRFRVEVGRKPGRKTYRAVVAAAGGARGVRSDSERVRVTRPVENDTTPPATPTGLAATPGDSQVHLTWDAVTDRDLAAYVVYRFEGGRWVEILTTVAEAADVVNLTNGVTYTFAVRAVDTTDNASSRSTQATSTPVAPDTTPPGAPTGVRALPGDIEVTLIWDAVQASDLSYYRVFSRLSGAPDWVEGDPVTGATNHTFTGLSNGTAYDFAVSAVDDDGNESALSDVSATPVAPPLGVPTGLVASPGDGQVALDWDAVPDPRVIGYRLEVRDAADGEWRIVPDSVTTGTEEVVSGLVNGTSYTFSVIALADDTESSRSAVATATPGP